LTAGASGKDNLHVLINGLPMKTKRVIAGKSSRFAAQLFNIASVAAITAGITALMLGKLLASHKIGFLPFVLSFPPLMIWLAASIFVYASIAHHPNERTRLYHRWAGYRFYGATGAMVVVGQPVYGLLGGWNGLAAVWALLFLIIVPPGLYAIWKAAREEWPDMTIEVAINE
jgi:hypothetical protein